MHTRRTVLFLTTSALIFSPLSRFFGALALLPSRISDFRSSFLIFSDLSCPFSFESSSFFKKQRNEILIQMLPNRKDCNVPSHGLLYSCPSSVYSCPSSVYSCPSSVLLMDLSTVFQYRFPCVNWSHPGKNSVKTVFSDTICAIFKSCLNRVCSNTSSTRIKSTSLTEGSRIS